MMSLKYKSIKIKQAILSTVTLCSTLSGSAQLSGALKWWSPAQNSFPVVQGQAWPGEVKNSYDRLPARAEKTVRSAVWNLSQQSAGLSICFQTNARQIVVRYTVTKAHAMPHMPATGVSGVDLYSVDKDGQWRWTSGKYSFSDTIEYRFNNLETDKFYSRYGRAYELYLPLYNTISWLQIGIPDSATLTPQPLRREKPVVVYGTSIAQGACASRPGMAWTSLLERRLGRPVINLGFSGNGRMEKEVIDLLAEIDARVYVLDCLANLQPAEAEKRVLDAIRQLRSKKPTTPIVLAEHSDDHISLLDTAQHNNYTRLNEGQRRAVKQLAKAGAKNLYVLPASAINLDIEATVDGLHPTDVGMIRYADAYEALLRVVLNEPVGSLSTTRPVVQYRDAAIYDWQERHTRLLTLNKEKNPHIVFIGNSITHYWGGEPSAPISRGADSWKEVLEPAGIRNFGFGWDRVENVLWRIYHDELDGYKASQVVLLIGTNNLGINTDSEIIEGLRALAAAIKMRQPQARILFLGLLPRRAQEMRITGVNKLIARLAAEIHADYTDPGKALLRGKTINESLFTDGLHPNAEGYRKLAVALQPLLATGKAKP